MYFQEVLIVCVLLTVSAWEPVYANKTTLFEKYFKKAGCTPRPDAYNIEDRATCPFTMAVDVDSTRIPSELPVVKCNCPDNLCSSVGDYRCKEVRNTIHVAYRDGTGGSKLRNGTIELTTSCVCAVGRSAPAEPIGTRVIG
ncbi:hypothetical protein HPB48_006767 [Haemaphysalis longicornis]|uniref:Uncharacterized protein n=1 Tax=Haemaphysalis longicornis TaxID=44386 RepID=A0A9J6FLP9_HAELO|nr:hypothetical protein HPB48_006767 [Haemaphysalis longicornis]